MIYWQFTGKMIKRKKDFFPFSFFSFPIILPFNDFALFPFFPVYALRFTPYDLRFTFHDPLSVAGAR